MTACLQIGVDPLLQHSQPLFRQPCDLRLREGLELDVGERRPAPEVEGALQDRGAVIGLRLGASLCDQLPEALEVELFRTNRQCISRRLRHQNVGADGLPELRDEVL